MVVGQCEQFYGRKDMSGNIAKRSEKGLLTPENCPAPPIVAVLGLLGMVLGEQFGVWIQTKKLNVSRAASVCLVGERYDRRDPAEAPRTRSQPFKNAAE